MQYTDMKKLGLTLLLMTLFGSSYAQSIAYSEPDGGDFRQSDFEILGKLSNNILIFKNLRSSYAITVYDINMKEKEKVKLDFLPDKIINPDFIAYPDFLYMFYQYQKKNIVYAMAAKLDANAKIVGEPITMDTTEISFLASNKIYTAINCDNKQKIGLFKINSKNDDAFLVTTLLFDNSLNKIEKDYLNVPMPDRHDYLTEFQLGNTGEIVFLRAIQETENDQVERMELLIKAMGQQEIKTFKINTGKINLDDVRLKVDNFNNSYIITSLYSKTKRGNIDGLFTAIWDKKSEVLKATNVVEFDENLRNEARGDNSSKSAFNDFFIKHFIVRKDGGFLLAAESLFTSGRSGGFNRFDNMYGSPFLQPMDYYMLPYGYSYGSPWGRYNNMGQTIRYNAQNIMVLSLDSTGKLSWQDVISKNQYDDETDALISYSVLNTGGQLHFIFNQPERRIQLLTSNTISPSGEITRNPTLRNLSSGYEIMARYGKQTGSRQIIFPCIYRNYLCFARLDF